MQGKSNQRFQALFNYASIGILLTDAVAWKDDGDDNGF